MKKDAFGINMKRWCREHEALVLAAEPSEALLSLHREKIGILQHERLVHLIVTVMAVLAELFILDLALLHPDPGLLPALLLPVLAILLGFYFYHYFFLENTLQRWYRLTDELREKLRQQTG